MRQVDSNIVIDAMKPGAAGPAALAADVEPICVSVATLVEVLGFHQLDPLSRRSLEAFFAMLDVLPIDDRVIRQAIALRQTRKMSLGDALIAATALVLKLPLVTRNTRDFSWIADLTLIDPGAAP